MSADVLTCVLCPRLCRPACPVATGTGREAATPTALATALYRWERGDWSADLAAYSATLCTDCGACRDWCHLERPLPEILRAARAVLLPRPAIEPLRPMEGEGSTVAVEADGRPMAAALAKRLGRPVRRWQTGDALGLPAIEHAGFEARASRIREMSRGLEVVVADGGVANVLDRVGVPFRWLHEVFPDLAVGLRSCRAEGDESPLACCGAAGPLAAHHPEDARRVGATWLEMVGNKPVIDARCRNHLRVCGGTEVKDPLDLLLERFSPEEAR